MVDRGPFCREKTGHLGNKVAARDLPANHTPNRGAMTPYVEFIKTFIFS